MRVFWYFEIFADEKVSKRNQKYSGAFDPLVDYIAHAAQLCVCCMKKLLVDIPLAGGYTVLMCFFFVNYVVAVVFWRSEGSLADPDPPPECASLVSCYITMLRLVLYDDYGFDFLTATIDHKSPALSVLLILFLCFNAMVLLNGLIGIVGGTFSTAVDGGPYSDGNDDDDDGGDEKDIDDAADGDEGKSGSGKYASVERIGESDSDDDDDNARFDRIKFSKKLNNDVVKFLAYTKKRVTAAQFLSQHGDRGRRPNVRTGASPIADATSPTTGRSDGDGAGVPCGDDEDDNEVAAAAVASRPAVAEDRFNPDAAQHATKKRHLPAARLSVSRDPNAHKTAQLFISERAQELIRHNISRDSIPDMKNVPKNNH